MPDKKKKSYTIPCSSIFRKEIIELANSLKSNVADLARSILLLIPKDQILSVPDPGGPLPQDREHKLIKSGPSAGKVWKLKPRLQVRLPEGYTISVVRRALNIALRLNKQHLVLTLNEPKALSAPPELHTDLLDQVERLHNIISILSFTPLEQRITTPNQALYILGFAPDANPDTQIIHARYRKLAGIHHPDSSVGDTDRMTQLNAALDFLCK